MSAPIHSGDALRRSLSVRDLTNPNAAGPHAMQRLVDVVVRTLLPGHAWRTSETTHPYTVHGREIEVRVDDGDRWIEIGECGVANPRVLERAGVDVDRVRGLAMGLGLDRVLMIRKRI